MKPNIKPILSVLAFSTLFLFAGCSKENNQITPKEDETPEVLPAFKTINGIDCVLINAGSFVMGLSESEENYYESLIQHNVTITKDFYLGKYPVTNAQYCEFLNAEYIGEDGMFKTKYDGEQMLVEPHEWSIYYEKNHWLPQEGKEDFPIVCVTWYGADEFCRWAGGKLPTEAQWEYACKAGTSTKYFFGDDINLYDDYSWINNNEGSTHKVGTKLPNNWCLYDMYGNVWEWCSDWYDEDYYKNSPLKDPEQKVKPESAQKCRRGGDFHNYKVQYHAIRGYDTPDFYVHSIGFRFCNVP